MKIYNYHGVTGEFLSASDARPNPMEKDEFLVPANSTKIKPPSSAANKTPVFNGVKWNLVADHRKDGKKYYSKSTGDLIELDLGDVIDSSMQETVPKTFQDKIDEEKRTFDIKSEAVKRMKAIIPMASNFETVGLINEMWNSLKDSSKSQNSKFKSVSGIYAVADAAILDGTTLVGSVVWP